MHRGRALRTQGGRVVVTRPVCELRLGDTNPSDPALIVSTGDSTAARVTTCNGTTCPDLVTLIEPKVHLEVEPLPCWPDTRGQATPD